MSFLKGVASFINPAGGVTTQDPNTYEIVYTPSEPIVINNATFTQLSSTEKVERQQLQDDSSHKVRIDFNDTNKTIDHTFIATIENDEYNITGKPKHPVMGEGRITIYLTRKG